jgi:hypothetical protein
MPRITVEIEWDWPEDSFWLNADNVAVALHAYCPNSGFVVREVTETAVLHDAIVRAMAELGVPEPGYPAPVANAYQILSEALVTVTASEALAGEGDE